LKWHCDAGIRSAYHTGRGSVVMRGNVAFKTIRKERARWLIGALSIYPVLFLAFATAMELFYFSGCLGEKPADPHFGFMAIIACAGSSKSLLGNLAVLGNPAFAIPLFAAGWAVMLAGVVLVIAQSHFRRGFADFLPARRGADT
jgi:hypothetical protein